ncbi:uncharacterized protein LOC141910313 [Tubulanus polymorphus]|uniref:uncharacterized protein LOC141910313 n=1 Tax=Tubulanus polymorphus TaxID=672921 RepID=UPI003DA2264B
MGEDPYFFEIVVGKKSSDGQSPVNIRREAKLAVIRAIQRKYFTNELKALNRQQPVSKSSPLRKLCPEIDECGFLRVGGRLNDSLLPHEGKHPIILPRSEPLVNKLIRRTHCMEGHVGRIHTISKLREQYWIIGLTNVVRKLLKDCVTCRKYQARLETQKMGVLPKDRTSATHAFENSGIDYFGPLRLTIGRREEKRYGVLFSCNFTRAIHIELARRLDTQSCLLAISRFVKRRGSLIIESLDRCIPQ